jgi:hypothetical protein
MQTQARFLLYRIVNKGNGVRQVSKHRPGQVISLRTSRRPKQVFLLYIRVNKGNDVRQVAKGWPGHVISLKTPRRPRQGFCST